MMASNNPVTTVVVSVVALVLSLPVAVVAIVFNRNWVPHVVLGTKTIKTGLNDTRVLEFGVLSGANDAVYASALISLASTGLFITGLVLIRHFTRHNGWGWVAFGPTLLNLLGSVACCAAVYMFKNRYATATSTEQIRYVNGQYNTGGKLYTREGWACSMNALYAEREGDWAEKACSNFGIARVLTIPLVACAACLFGVAYWQIHQQGGLGWLFGRRDKIIAAYKPKGEYIDLQG